MKKILLLLTVFCTSQLLVACVPAALVASGAAGAAFARDNRDMKTIGQDAHDAYLANQQLQTDPEVKAHTHVTAYVFNKTLLLTGQAPTSELKRRAEKAVNNIEGVKKVYNEITIEEPLNALAQSRDAMLTANIRGRLVATTDLKSSQFKVITENRTVYLLGFTTQDQANIAAEVIRHSSGVHKVVKIIDIYGAG